MNQYITTNPEIMGGQPCIVGTRIPVSLIVIRLRQGYKLKEIQEMYPHVPLTTFEGALTEVAEQVSHTPYDAQNLQA